MADERLTTLLDDFQRADENPLSKSGQWDATFSGANQMRLITTVDVKHATRQAGTATSSSRWNAQAQDGDCEVWGERYEIGSQPGYNDRLALWTAGPSVPVGSLNGYILLCHTSAGGHAFTLYRTDGGVNTSIGGTANGVDGNNVLLRTFGTKVQLWHHTSDWASLALTLDITDNTYRTGLYPVIGEGHNTPVSGDQGGWTSVGGGAARAFVPQIYRRV